MQKALSLSTESCIKMDADGVLNMVIMIKNDAGTMMDHFVEFYIKPLLDDDELNMHDYNLASQ